jgi:hypothetical protein
MSIRDTFQRNVDGLNDLLIKNKNEINAGVKQLAETASYGDALAYLEEKIANAVLDIEKRRKSVVEILKTKLKLSFDSANEGIASEWEKAVVDMKSQLEIFAAGLKSDLSKKFEQIQTPVIEQILIDMVKKKAFTRVTFEFLSNRLKIPKNKIEEIAENLILDGKLEARLDLPSETLIFMEDATQMKSMPSKPSAPVSPSKPSAIPKPSLKKESPKAISLDIPISEGPQLIDLSLEPSDLDISESPPDSIETTSETVETEPMEISLESTPTSMPAETKAQETLDKSEASTKIEPEPKVDEEEKEAESIISFFKSSVVELTEQEKEEARKKREEKKRELEARRKQKQEDAKGKEEEKKEPEVQIPEEPEIQKPEEPEVQKIEKSEIQKPVTMPTKAQDLLKSGPVPSPKPEPKPGIVAPAPKIEPPKGPKTSPIITPTKPQIPLGFKPAAEISEPPKPELKAPIATKPVGDLVIPAKSKEEPSTLKDPAMGSDKGSKCVFCGKAVRKEDHSVILCPHSCGALGHKDEFIKKGQCPKCKAEVKEIDIAFNELL